jgi:hypothetical protein
MAFIKSGDVVTKPRHAFISASFSHLGLAILEAYPDSCARNYLYDIVVLATTSPMRFLTQGAINEFSYVDRAHSVRLHVCS